LLFGYFYVLIIYCKRKYNITNVNSNNAEQGTKNVNFSKREEELLVELVTTDKHVLENKKSRRCQMEGESSLLDKTGFVI